MHDKDNNTRRQKPEPEKNKYNLTPETARVGVQIGKVTSGALQMERTLYLWRSSEEESDCSSDDPEDIGKELAMLVKKFQKFTKKKGFRKSSRSSSRNDEASDHKKRTGHKCKKHGHYISECPQWDNETKKKKSKEYDSDDKKKKKNVTPRM